MAEGTVNSGLGLTPIAPFDPMSDPTSISQRWKSWKRRFEAYAAALNIKDDKQKRAVLLYQVGEATQDIFETFSEKGEDYATAMTKLDEYFSPKKNVDYEIFQFRKAVQQPGETIDQYATRLRKLATNCEFPDLNRELKSTIIQNCLSKRLRRVALRDDLTLDALLAKARSMEASEMQASGIEEFSTGTVQKVFSKNTRRSFQQMTPPLQQTAQPARNSAQCQKCGYTWPHRNSVCPAQGQTCNKCGKPNHFARMCMTGRRTLPPQHNQHPQSSSSYQPKQFQKPSRVHQVTTHDTPEEASSDEASDDEYLYMLCNSADSAKTPVISVSVNNVPVKMMVDSGSSIDIMDESSFAELCDKQDITLQPSKKRIFAYGSEKQLIVRGQFTADITSGENHTRSIVHVVEGNFGSLLSYQTSQNLGIIDIKVNLLQSPLSIGEKLTQKYPKLFQGIGKLEVSLHIDDTVQPVAQAARRIPFHLRKQVSEELHELERQGIIEKVEGPTPWVSPLVVIPKKNGVRLCVDMRMPNKAIQRERHPTPTIDDLIHKLNGATVFSKLDLKAGYHQIPLAPESRYITTFATHKGLRRYTRLNFGTNSASEIFQNVVSELLRDIDGAFNISDDIIIFGTTQEDHDKALDATCRKLADVDVTLNKPKCEFNKSSISFFGFIFSKDGISPDPAKVQAIHNMFPPKSVPEVRSFLGMATYCAKFIPSFSDISQPLRELTKKNVPFRWTHLHQNSFDKIKEMLSSETTMAYFDPGKETELTTDASPVGLSAILSQRTSGKDDRKIVAYASRSLTEVERRYSQTEKEALAIVWSIERLHLYLYGKQFTLYTDCKPVQLIFSNATSRPPARIERWNLRLQGYKFQIVHTRGEQNPSDFLSRHPTISAPKREEKMAEDYVNFLSLHAVPRALTLAEIQEATKADKTLQQLIQIIQSNQWHTLKFQQPDGVDEIQLKKFVSVKEELSVNSESNLILRGSRIVIPTTLQQRAVEIAHEGHQGIVKTKKTTEREDMVSWY